MFEVIETSDPGRGIFIFDDVFPESFCDDIVKFFDDELADDQKGPGRLGAYSHTHLNYNIKKSIDSHPDPENEAFNTWNKLYLEQIKICFEKTWGFVREQQPGMELSSLMIQKYEQNEGFFKYHYDGLSNQGRNMTSLTYFNDVEEGGETFFHLQEVIVKARKGRVVVFPCNWTHPHEGRTPRSSHKYVGTCFWHLVKRNL